MLFIVLVLVLFMATMPSSRRAGTRGVLTGVFMHEPRQELEHRVELEEIKQRLGTPGLGVVEESGEVIVEHRYTVAHEVRGDTRREQR